MTDNNTGNFETNTSEPKPVQPPKYAYSGASNPAPQGAEGIPPYVNGGNLGQYYVPPAIKREAGITGDKNDRLFAVAAMVMGYLFIRSIIIAESALWFAIFPAIYSVAVVIYTHAKKGAVVKEGFFWLAVSCLCGISLALNLYSQMDVYAILLTFAAAIYGTAVCFNGQIEGCTGDFLPLDLLNCFVVVPFSNFNQYYNAIFKSSSEKKAKKSGVGAVIMALLILTPVLIAVVPLLMAADSGIFSQLIQNLTRHFNNLEIAHTVSYELSLIISFVWMWLPGGMYIAGLGLGYAHERKSRQIEAEKMREQGKKLRICPENTAAIVIIAVSSLYLLFVGCQVPYFFSAFAGKLPEGVEVYSRYAREGFFELCKVAVINILLVAGFSLTQKGEKRPLFKWCSNALMGITLLILATSFSKMWLYISVYGYTEMRFFVITFMLVLAFTCINIIRRQHRDFSVMRYSAFFGAGIFAVFFMVNALIIT